jgi:hypothetical protein
MAKWGLREAEKQKKKRSKEYKAKTRELRVKYKDTRQLVKEMHENVFNPYIRLRDRKDPCISCGKHKKEYHAGHFHSVGARKDIRFNEDNCHKQCAGCNKGETYQRANADTITRQYEANLIKKIGRERVESLAKVQVKKYTYEELLEIKRHFKTKLDKIKEEIKNNDH